MFSEDKLDEFKKKLDDGKKELDKAKNGLANANTQIQNGSNQLKESKEKEFEFLDNEDHMDGCGPLRKYENPEEYIEVCIQKSNPNTADTVGGQAEQFLLVRESDNRLVGI